MGVVLLCGALRFLVWDLGVFFLEGEEGRGGRRLGVLESSGKRNSA